MDENTLVRVSGLRLSQLCPGTMTFGGSPPMGADREVSRQIFDAFADAGGNFLDTANSHAQGHTQGHAEGFVGEFIASDRDA